MNYLVKNPLVIMEFKVKNVTLYFLVHSSTPCFLCFMIQFMYWNVCETFKKRSNVNAFKNGFKAQLKYRIYFDQNKDCISFRFCWSD